MEINPNRQMGPAIPVGAPFKAKPTAPGTGAADAEFEQSAGLDAALRATPDSRADVVSRAEELVSQSSYPPPETINRIANLLAANLIEENAA